MGSYHPATASAGNPYAQVQAGYERLVNRIRTVEARPPAGVLTATRIDTPPPSTSNTDDTVLWRVPPSLPGTVVLLGISATLTGTAAGNISITAADNTVLARLDAPFAADVGPFPATWGQLTVSAARTSGTGTVAADVLAVRYGPHLDDDTQSALDPDAEEDTPTDTSEIP